MYKNQPKWMVKHLELEYKTAEKQSTLHYL